MKKTLDVVYLLAELDGRHFEVFLLDLKIGIFRLKFFVVGRLEGHLDVTEPQTDGYEKAEQSNSGQDMKDARRQLQLPKPRTSVRHNNKGIKALGHSRVLLLEFSRGPKSFSASAICLNKKDLLAINPFH